MRKNDTRVFLDIETLPARIDAIADGLRARYGHLAKVTLVSPEHHAYEVVPINARGCSFAFVLDQWLNLEVAGGRWELDWTEEGIALFGEMTASVAEGRIRSARGFRKAVVQITLESGEVRKSTVSQGLLGAFELTGASESFEPWADEAHHPDGL